MASHLRVRDKQRELDNSFESKERIIQSKEDNKDTVQSKSKAIESVDLSGERSISSKWRARSALEALIRSRKTWNDNRSASVDIRPTATEDKSSDSQTIEKEHNKTVEEKTDKVKNTEKAQNNKSIDRSEVSEKKESFTTKHSLPTFGEIPIKFSRQPYYTVRGRALNVAIVDASDRYRSKDPLFSGSLSGSTSSQPEGDFASSSESDKERSNQKHQINSRGFSNISNLFPGRPIINRKRTKSTNHSLRQPDPRIAVEDKKSIGQNLALSGQTSLGSQSQMERANMRRQNSLIGMTSAPFRSQPVSNGMVNRPASVSGQYTGGGRIQHRSPSATSLHYGTSGATSNYQTPYERALDPNCAVHGQSAYELDKTGTTNLTSPTEDSGLGYPAYGDRINRRSGQGVYSERQAHDYRTKPGGYASAHSLHSPGSPTEPISPYYDQTSRFSLYRAERDRNGFRPRSTLAPPKEQIRRILGYNPPIKPVHLHPQWAYSRPFHHLLPSGTEWTPSPIDQDGQYMDDDEINDINASLLQFIPFNRLEDNQAIRAVDFHPSGQVYAIGSNSRALRICAYPATNELNQYGSNLLNSPSTSPTQQIQSPRILFKFLQVHRGSIYCVRFNKSGQLLATGSNDQTVHIVKYNSRVHSPEGDEYRLTIHDGTVRDLCFIDDQTSGNSLLLSAGGGDNKIYVTDCDTITPYQSFAGHTQMVMALNHIGGAQFVSASQDKTIRFWDLRTRQCTSIVSAPPLKIGNRWSGGPGAPACAVQSDHSGRLLVSGHSDSTCMLYDTRGSRIIQTFRPHEDEVRTISFSPRSYYLLTGGYDGKIVLSDLQGDLNQPLPSVCVAELDDKIIQSRWHPTDFTFVTTSANKTATLWIPPTDL